MSEKFTFYHLMTEFHHIGLQQTAFLTTPHPLGLLSHGQALIRKANLSQECCPYQWGNEKETSRNNYHLFSSINTGAIPTIRISFSGAGRKNWKEKIDMEIATA